ncbi:MAG: sugar phosphate isomerase/epimerase [Treponema sp.]|nr:sugar phosphate isomerase/epimerase [Treponema sp.]
MLYFGCHAVLFGEKIKTDTAAVLENLAKTGFAGIECGFRFIGDDLPRVLDEIKKQGLLFSGFHAGTKFADFLGGPEPAGDLLLKISDKLLQVPASIMPYKNIVMSGNFEGLQDKANLEKAVLNFNEVAGMIKSKGVSINYHNHAREFENGGAIYRTLLEKIPNMNFGFDLGWVEAGGGNIETVLKEAKGRVQYVHLRDLVKTGGKEFADLGNGVTDLPKVIKLAKETIGADGWIVVEYETGEKDYSRYTRAREYLKKIGY